MEIVSRDQLPLMVNSDEPIGLELGVAKGDFSAQLLSCIEWAHFFAIDKWNDHHNMSEYWEAKLKLEEWKGVLVIRSTFADARILFPNAFFDFIYIDGYAHTGQEGGETLDQWWTALKIGGIFAGHDYHPQWQPTIDAVDDFADRHRLTKPSLTTKDEFPSWWFVK